MQEYVSFVIGTGVGVLTAAGLVVAFGKWMLRAVVKEVISEVQGQWVATPVGEAQETRISRLERQFDDTLKVLASRGGIGC